MDVFVVMSVDDTIESVTLFHARYFITNFACHHGGGGGKVVGRDVLLFALGLGWVGSLSMGLCTVLSGNQVKYGVDYHR